MPDTLANYARLMMADPALFELDHTAPILLWEAAHRGDEELLLGTNSGIAPDRPSASQPLVFELKKQGKKQNAFATAVTVGRTENNDIPLPDNSVSRFHAFFEQDPRSGHWKLVDAESKNGTFVGTQQLPPKTPVLLTDQTKIRFGDLTMTFFTAEGFRQYVQGLIDG